MSMLEALVRYHDRSVRTALSKEQLGIPGAARGGTLSTTLPASEVAEFEGRTKDRHVLCVETSDAGLVGLLGPCSWGGGRKMTKDLVRAGVHPLDIIIGSEADGRWTFRTAVDWMFWTAEDQDALEDPQTAS